MEDFSPQSTDREGYGMRLSSGFVYHLKGHSYILRKHFKGREGSENCPSCIFSIIPVQNLRLMGHLAP